MNYGDLRAAIAAYLHRSDLTDVIPTFIEAARTRINRDLRVRENLTTQLETPTENPRPLPADYVEMRDLSYTRQNQRISLENSPRAKMSVYDTSNITQTEPQFYSVDGLQIETRPGGIGIEFRWYYYAAVPELVNDTDTNILLTVYPTIWLYASLIEAHSYNQDEELRLAATDIYTSEVQQANAKATSGERNAQGQWNGASQWL